MAQQPLKAGAIGAGVSAPASASWICPSPSSVNTPSITQQWKWTAVRCACAVRACHAGRVFRATDPALRERPSSSR